MSWCKTNGGENETCTILKNVMKTECVNRWGSQNISVRCSLRSWEIIWPHNLGYPTLRSEFRGSGKGRKTEPWGARMICFTPLSFYLPLSDLGHREGLGKGGTLLCPLSFIPSYLERCSSWILPPSLLPPGFRCPFPAVAAFLPVPPGPRCCWWTRQNLKDVWEKTDFRDSVQLHHLVLAI